MSALPGPSEERLLLLMGSERDAARTVGFLAKAGVNSHVCSSWEQLAQELREGAAGVLLSAEVLLRGKPGALAQALGDPPSWSSIPLVVLIRESDGALARQLTGEANVTLVERPVRRRTLVSVVEAALRARRYQYEVRDAIVERERQAAALREKDERLRFALAVGRLGSWELDLTSAEMICSSICKANYGRRPDETFSYQDLYASIHEEDVHLVRDAIRQALENRGDYDVEYRCVWPDQSVHWVMVRGRGEYDATGFARRMIGVSLDVTARKLNEEALRESSRRKDEFLATLAHELRNPLAPLRTGLELLKRSPEGAAARHSREMMDRQLSHMVRLIDDLLDVSRITRDKVELRRERVALRSVLEAAIESSRPLIDASQHQLELALPTEAIWLDADPTRVAQVVSNLLNNAAKYTPDGGRIRLEAACEHELAVIRVTDNGAGIPEDQRANVFEMFTQVNRTLDRSQGGLGIGLALVKKLLDLHNGTIDVESPGLGRGSTFTVRLPALAGREASAPVHAAVGKAPAGARRILVVDDNVDAAEALALLLEMSGHTTRMAHDGHEALSAARDFGPEVVLLDIGLPGLSGYEVAAELRATPALSSALIVALTGWGTLDDKRRALEAGFDFHLTKPVDPSAVERLLAENA